MTPLLGYSRKEQKILPLGCAVLVTMLLTTLCVNVLQGVLANVAYLAMPVYVAVVLVIVGVLHALGKLIFKKGLGIYFPVVALNAAVVGVAMTTVQKSMELGSALLYTLGAGLGFALALFAMCGVETKLNDKAVPAAFRGLPVRLLALGILPRAVLAF